MNIIFYIFMKEYKKNLIDRIYHTLNSTLKELEERIKNNLKFIINRNEEGKMHSRYLGDRYEPAIVMHDYDYRDEYYLFDGDLKTVRIRLVYLITMKKLCI